MELVKGYDSDISYYPGNANVVAYALSHKSMILSRLTTQQQLISEFQRLSLEVLRPNEASRLMTLTVTPNFLDLIRIGQAYDQQLSEWKRRDETKGHALYMTVDETVRYKG